MRGNPPVMTVRDGDGLKRRLPELPRERKGGERIALSGNIPKGVIHIELQELFWIVSIAWIFVQAWGLFKDKKK